MCVCVSVMESREEREVDVVFHSSGMKAVTAPDVLMFMYLFFSGPQLHKQFINPGPVT